MTAPTAAERAAYRLVFVAERDPRARRALVALVRAALRLVAFERRRGGHRLFDASRALFVRFGEWRAPVLQRKLGLDASHMGDLGRLQEWEDRAFDVAGHFTERGASCATRHETVCPYADIARGAPEICTDLVHALETATFRTLNPTYELLPLERLLSKGHDHCAFRHRIAGGALS